MDRAARRFKAVSAGGKPENLARSACLDCWRQRVLDGPVQPAEAETVGEGAQSESRALPLVSVARGGEDDLSSQSNPRQ